MSDPVREIVEREQQADAEKVKALRWFARYGVVLLLVSGLLLARLFGVI